jgi:hypothetical protein
MVERSHRVKTVTSARTLVRRNESTQRETQLLNQNVPPGDFPVE